MQKAYKDRGLNDGPGHTADFFPTQKRKAQSNDDASSCERLLAVGAYFQVVRSGSFERTDNEVLAHRVEQDRLFHSHRTCPWTWLLSKQDNGFRKVFDSLTQT